MSIPGGFPMDNYERTTGHLVTCLAVAGGGSAPDCPGCSGPAQRRCVCGDPVQLQDPADPGSWIHSPGSDTPCGTARPLDHDTETVLEIVKEWVIEFNDVGGVDAGDLVWRLTEAGYALPGGD